ncbi:hypothetical protein SELMODRAFT_431568 [Selaginella moellendorffii]|uniref:Uncharacterized protein n=1 Tax=Selaginella moellendorffii TaxID=88036 RepID=D8TD29_SELML|nr:hypothetical protein SELMODRAFT_431568 [Selaginella moellendorffii]
MVDPDPGVSMQEPDGSRERGNAEASYSTGEAAGGSAIGGGAELGGRNEAPNAIGGGADLGGGNGGHAAALEGHRNEVVTMLEADTILNERVQETIVQAQERTISRVLVMEAVEAKLVARKGQELLTWYQVPMDFLVAVWAKPIVKAEQNSYLKITQVTEENMSELPFKSLGMDGFLMAAQALWISRTSRANHFSHVTWHIGAPVYTASVFLKLLTGGKKLGICGGKCHRHLLSLIFTSSVIQRHFWREWRCLKIGTRFILSRPKTNEWRTRLKTLLPHLILQQLLIPQILLPLLVQPRLLEIYEGNSIVRTSKRMSEKPASTLYVDDDLQELSSSASHKQVRPLSPTGSVGNVEIVIGDYFQLSNNMSRESSMFHRWMRGLGMNNTFSIDLAFFDLPDGLPPLQGDTPSWNILRLDQISQAMDVASKVLQYQGIMLVILPRSLFWGGLLATMVENDDSRLVEFASGCLLSNIAVETKGADG